MDNEPVSQASPITRPLGRCPSCGSDHLEPVVEARMQEVHFLCQACARCWDVALGSVRRVPPPTCFGCPARGRCDFAWILDHGTDQASMPAPNVD